MTAAPQPEPATPIVVDDAAALAAWLRDNRGPVRLCGSGTRELRLPAAPPTARAVSLRRLAAIVRLEADDLTCSVEPGVRVEALAAAAAEHGLELGFGEDDAGTVGGLFAADPLGPANVGQPCPRSTLLGAEAVLAGGGSFRAGARVVKSVAGFDVHRLLVGSRGRLFAATLLHLKLRPRPQADVAFRAAPRELEAAVALFMRLRALSPPLRRLVLRRAPGGGGFVVEGRCGGRAGHVAATLTRHGLAEVEAIGPSHLPTPAAGAAADAPPEGAPTEVVTGCLRPSRVAAFVALLPAAAPLVVHGGGRFEAGVDAATGDRLLAALPGLDATGAVAAGPPGRRGRCSAGDAGAERLERALRQQLDPAGILQ